MHEARVLRTLDLQTAPRFARGLFAALGLKYMGLEIVELVMAVEEHFDIEIQDDVAATLETVGLLHAHVVSQLEAKREQPVDREAVFFELRNVICEQTRIEPDKIVPEAYFVRDLQLD